MGQLSTFRKSVSRSFRITCNPLLSVEHDLNIASQIGKLIQIALCEVKDYMNVKSNSISFQENKTLKFKEYHAINHPNICIIYAVFLSLKLSEKKGKRRK